MLRGYNVYLFVDEKIKNYNKEWFFISFVGVIIIEKGLLLKGIIS